MVITGSAVAAAELDQILKMEEMVAAEKLQQSR
jgi:hypothetical protein